MSTFPDDISSLKVALCHDWLTGMRGGERVLEILCDAFPEAPIYTLIHTPSAVSDKINSHPIITSYLQRIPGITRHYRNFLPLLPSAIERMPLPDADLVISTSHCVAKSLRTRKTTRHLSYCFTPMRYAWTFYEEYFGTNPIKAVFVKPLLAALRHWDRKTSSRVDRFVAISNHVRQRIAGFYDRPADIVFPPVDTERCTPAPERDGSFDLIVSALVPYKRVDLAIEAYNELGYPLMIAGVGGQLPALRAMAKSNISFLEWQPDAAVLNLYRNCRFLVFPGEEDFGIVPLEAQACSTPVIAYARGGALETVKGGKTGVFFEEQTAASLIAGVQQAETMEWNRNAIRVHADHFGVRHFIEGMTKSIRACMA